MVLGGNILFGGLIGWLIVDPATGAMWTLVPKEINTELAEETALYQQKDGLTIILKDSLAELPASVKDEMKLVTVD